MGEDHKARPHVTEAGAAAARRRHERLATALRANLGRRKAQVRLRDDPADDLGTSPPAGAGAPGPGEGG